MKSKELLMSEMGVHEETVLKFGYPFDRVKEADRLAESLKSKGIKFIFYKSDGYWNHEFVVRKHKDYTWNETMRIINNVYAPRYKKVKATFDEQDREVEFSVITG